VADLWQTLNQPILSMRMEGSMYHTMRYVAEHAGKADLGSEASLQNRELNYVALLPSVLQDLVCQRILL